MFKRGFQAAVAAAIVASPAGATVYDFTATFDTQGINASPYASLTGSFDYSGTGESLDSFALDIGSTHYDASNTQIEFSPASGGQTLAIIGSNCDSYGTCIVNSNQDSFFLILTYDPATNQFDDTLSALNYGQAGLAHSVNAIAVTLTSGVPEPATWAMMLFGFAAIGFATRWRRTPRRVAVAAG